jgi:hypothetical protein
MRMLIGNRIHWRSWSGDGEEFAQWGDVLQFSLLQTMDRRTHLLAVVIRHQTHGDGHGVE